MTNQKQFRPYEPTQLLLLPPDLKDWLPEGDLAYFVMDIVNTLDLGPIYKKYDGSKGGQPPYEPRMMVGLLVYAYCVGVTGSRTIEQSTYHSVPFRIISGDQHPDHDTIAEFRDRHKKEFSKMFVQVLRLCQTAGLCKLGHVALDGSKVRANASKHKAMSYGRMVKKEKELKKDVARLLRGAESTDTAEDNLYGKGIRGNELPDELRFRESRLKKIQDAMKILEAQAELEANAQREEIRKKDESREDCDSNRRGPPPKIPSGIPDDKAQYNFTDPESRIMKDGASKSFEQSYNCQIAVDADAQIILASSVTQAANDKNQVKPMMEKLEENIDDESPAIITADNGYYSQDNIEYLEEKGIDVYIAAGRDKHGKSASPPIGRIPKGLTFKERMARKLKTIKGRCTYSKRKQIVEPVFGQIKEVRGIRRFRLRGFENVQAEWDIICMTHNILKLFRSGFALVPT